MMNSYYLLFFVLLCGSAAFSSNSLSTSDNGDFQAIAQSPTSIAVYWRHGQKSADIDIDGTPAGTIEQDPSKPFSCRIFTSLKPGISYAFSIDQGRQCVSEKTWCEMPDVASFDLLVIGGNASGVAAAITASRLGLRVALIEDTNRLGGMSSNGLGSTDIRQVSRANGIFDDFRRRVIDFYGEGNGLRYESRVANAIFKDMVYEHRNISLFLKSRVVCPILRDHKVLGAVVQDCVTGKSGKIYAWMSIDATDNGDFAAACGSEFRAGREPRSECEPHAGEIYFDDSAQSILPGSTGNGDNKQQSYAYLMIWKDYGDGSAPMIEKPRFYDPDIFRHSPPWRETWNATSGRLPNGKFEINQHPFGIDWPGINFDYPTADDARRCETEQMYKDRALGYLYYVQNELGHKNLGLADDEFLDNSNFPVSLYVRESRRIIGDCVFKECDVTNAGEINRVDSVAIGDYPMDSHATEDLNDPSRADKGEGEMWLASFTPWYQIPHSILVPKGISGLLVSTAVSASHVGYGTLRMEPVRFSMGQAAAAMAYWNILLSKDQRCINPALIQDKILSQGAYITWFSDVDRDARHFKAIQFMSVRGMSSGEVFNPDEDLNSEDLSDWLSKLVSLESGAKCDFLSAQETSDLTRGEFAIRLVQAKQRVSNNWGWIIPACQTYADVPKDSPYFAAVETLKAHRIDASLFEDYQQGMFRPDDPISRADAIEAIFLAHRPFAMRF